jgi:hypothetical protein
MENATMFGVTDWEAVKGPVQRVRRSLVHLVLVRVI